MSPSRADTFANKLRTLREAAGLSQYRLAQLSGVSKQMLSRLELGTTQPGWDTVQALARGLGVEVGSFVIKTDPPEPMPGQRKEAVPRGKRTKERGTSDRRTRPPHGKGVVGDRRLKE